MAARAKICGITDDAALEAAIAGGADYAGLVFFEKSPRHLELKTAAAIADIARGRIAIVALTVNAPDRALAAIIEAVRPDLLQLHGDETAERVSEIKSRFGLPAIKAIPVATAEDARLAQRYLGAADLILFDAKAPDGAALPGGNGLTFDWRALDGVAATFDFMLSGGLTAETVGDAIRLTRAAAVDVSSGVETAPGVKSPELIGRFLRAVKTANQA